MDAAYGESLTMANLISKTITTRAKRLARDERGATAIEYGLIVSLIVIAMVGALESVANENTGLWARVKSDILSSTNSGTSGSSSSGGSTSSTSGG